MSGGAKKQPKQATAMMAPTIGMSAPMRAPSTAFLKNPNAQRPLLPQKPNSLLSALAPKRSSMAFTKGPVSLKPRY